jgi:hypothetical protein
MDNGSAPLPKRLLLFIDILGFSDLCRKENADEVQRTLTDCLKRFHIAQSKTAKFKTIYFSDTVLFYQTTRNFNYVRFLELVEHAVNIFNSLLAAKIPVSGAIAFGGFRTPSDSDGRHPLYFGVPLVEGHEATEREKWLGITVCPSVTQLIKDSILEQGERDGRWLKRADKNSVTLCLNPFTELVKFAKSPASSKLDVKIDEAVETSMNALSFVHRAAKNFAVNGEFSTSKAVRYFATVEFARWVIAHTLADGQDTQAYDDIIALIRRRKNALRARL